MLKPELQAKFLNHLNKKKKGTEGFTLIELLVVIIIIGVLAAIALPSLLNQVSKARQSEARQNVGALNRAQQAYFLENSNKFATDVGDLGVGIKTQTQNYEYTIAGADRTQAVTNKGASRRAKLKSYYGVTYTIDQTVAGAGGVITESLTQAILCEAKSPYVGGGSDDNPTAETIGNDDTPPTADEIKGDTGGCEGQYKPLK
ncbi:MAG: type IV pilin-like G/H family protein [Nostocaceae cyanobacterium]|nr:type IV pilin-like G/H family protein [Nostocaceae cyanobacterium]